MLASKDPITYQMLENPANEVTEAYVPKDDLSEYEQWMELSGKDSPDDSTDDLRELGLRTD